jgi:hypothetical protein
MMARETSLALASLIALCVWLGAAALTALVVAPAAFEVLPSRTLAGSLVGRVLPVLFWSGLAIGLGVAAAAWSTPRPLARTAAAVVMAAACAVAQLVVAPRIQRIRDQIGDGAVDALAPSDPLRQAFGRLHGMSVAWMGLAGIAAIVAVILLVRLSGARSTP